MGMTLVEKLDRIFAKTINFDISGMYNPNFVTVELAKELADAYKEPGEWYKLAKAGYDIHSFGRGSGMIGKWVKKADGRRTYDEHLKLYFDQDFPARIEESRRLSAEQAMAAVKEANTDE